MKQRFSSLDVKVIAHELSNNLSTLRLANVYDLSSRIFLFKFAKPNLRHQMVVDSGFRCHLTNYSRATAAAPSAFVVRLRKYLKTRRVTSVAQVGTDRIIEFQFSDGQYKLFLEFYAGGNIVLTDKELNILALLRIVQEGQDQEELRVGLRYSLENRQNYGGIPPLTPERVRAGLERALDKASAENTVGKKPKKSSKDALRKALAVSLSEFPPMLLDHALRVTKYDPTTAVEDVLKSEELLDSLMEVLHEAKRAVSEITAAEISKGYIVAKRVRARSSEADTTSGGDVVENEGDKENMTLKYEDFQPFRPKESEGLPDMQVLEFDGFNRTVDEFFSSIESQKLESRLTEREENARKKLEAARLDHEKRVGGLQQVQELNVRKAQAIEGNLQRVQEAISAINGLIAQGMDWAEIARLIEMEQARGNPVAEMIKLPLKLYENTATLLLEEADFDDDDDYDGDETDSDVEESEDEDEIKVSQKGLKASKSEDKRLDVDVDLSLSPWSNARQYYEQRKTAAVKEQKTILSSTMALKSTEKKITADLNKGLKQEKQLLRPVRKQFWFEKFYYFVSSEGYLVLGGRDAQQTEILYKRYLSKGDLYVHADLSGAVPVIIKNKPGIAGFPIPPSTLSQAGSFCVSTSVAWGSKAMMAAWWVESKQVSKTAPNGDYLAVGLFEVRGTKNFLPPSQLLLGFGVLFRVSEASLAQHNKYRIKDEDTRPASNEQTAAKEEIMIYSDHDEVDAMDTDESGPDEMENRSSPQSNDGNDEDDNSEGGNPTTYVNPLQSGGVFDQDSTQELGEDTTMDDHNDSLEEDAETTENLDEVSKSIENTSGKYTEGVEKDPTALMENLTVTGKKTAPKPAVRGKRGKKAKEKDKYAHQDDEDRTLALRLLGAGHAQQKTISETEARATRDAEAAAQKERRRDQHLRAQQSGKESEEAHRRQLEEGAEPLDDEEMAELGLVAEFVGIPLPGDEILDSLVVCGPWEAMGARMKWRIKLQPGTVKKGKVVKEILGVWNKEVAAREKKKMPSANDDHYEEEKVIRKEGELIKGLRDVEVVGIVPVKSCRIMVSGASSVEKSKAGKGGGKSNRGGRGSKKTKRN